MTISREKLRPYLNPGFKILLPWITGTWLGITVECTAEHLMILASLLTFLCGAAYSLLKTRNNSRAWSIVLHPLLLFCAIGHGQLRLHQSTPTPSLFKTDVDLILKVTQRPTASSNLFLANIIGQNRGHTLQPASGKICLVNWHNRHQPIKEDDIVFIASPIMERIKSPENPYAFDPKKYWRKHNVGYQLILEKNGFLSLAGHQSTWRQIQDRAAQRLHSQLNHAFKSSLVTSVSRAFLTGDKSIDKQTRHTFAQAGIAHLLAVSGLHVGVIYLALTFFFRLLFKKKYSVSSFLLLTALLSFYCALCAFAPSVCRATIMLVLFFLSRILIKYNSTLNTVSITCLLLIVFVPNILFDIGFLLSFAAVYGLVLWMPMIRFKGVWSKPALRYLTGILAMSFIAQIYTMPISALYFHQFPTYFLLSNLIALPLFTLAIYSLLMGLTLSFILPSIGKLLFSLTEFFLQLLIDWASWITNLPFSKFNLDVDVTHVVLWFALISWIFLLVLNKQKIFFYALLFTLILSSVLHVHKNKKAAHQYELVIYDKLKVPALEIYSGHKSYSFGTENSNDRLYEFWDLGRIHNQINESIKMSHLQNGDCLFLENAHHQIMIFAWGEFSPPSLKKPAFLILHNRLPRNAYKKWTKWAHKWNVPIHELKRDGIFIQNLNKWIG